MRLDSSLRRARHALGLLSLLVLVSLTAAGCAGPLSYPRYTAGTPLDQPPPARRQASRPAAPRPASRPSPEKAASVASADMLPAELDALVSYAESLLGASHIVADGERFKQDCSGLVRACYYTQGMDLFDVDAPGRSGSESIYFYVQEHGRVFTRGLPEPGDIVFFHNTYDRNRNGRRDDLFTHVALVESVDDKGTVTIIHTMNSGIIRSRMNLGMRDEREDPMSGEIVNDYVRRPDSRGSPALASELFFAYGRLF